MPRDPQFDCYRENQGLLLGCPLQCHFYRIYMSYRYRCSDDVNRNCPFPFASSPPEFFTHNVSVSGDRALRRYIR